jgi:hypothetical protein
MEQVDRGRFRVLHDHDDSWRAVGRRRMGRLLELGPEGDLGADRLAQLRGLVAHEAGRRAARANALHVRICGVYPAQRPIAHYLRKA